MYRLRGGNIKNETIHCICIVGCGICHSRAAGKCVRMIFRREFGRNVVALVFLRSPLDLNIFYKLTLPLTAQCNALSFSVLSPC